MHCFAHLAGAERFLTDPKPRLNGVGSLKSKENRRSRTISGFGSIRSKIFPSGGTPTDEKSAAVGENGETKAPAEVPPRPKRLSFFGKLKNAVKPS